MDWDGSLVGAVDRNDAAAVQRTLRNGADVNCREEDATTPLMEACEKGFDDIVRILLDAGADARWRNSHNESPIERACFTGHLSIVKMLLNHDNSLLEIADEEGFTILLLAIKYQQVDIVRFLLDRGANIHASTHDGTTTLMRACIERNLAIVRILLTAGVDVEARDEDQRTAMHYASMWQLVEVIRGLIFEHNANMFAVEKYGFTPFGSISRQTDNPAGNQFLIIYSNKMTQDHGPLALHAIIEAAEYAFFEDAEFHPPLTPILQIRLPLGKLTLNHFRFLLSTFDTNLIRSQDDSGKLPIHLACRTKAPVEVLSMHVEIDPATLHIADHAGALPLHECCCGAVDDLSVRFLVEQGGVGTLAARTREGALPLHVLCESTNPSWHTVQYMVQFFPGSVAARTNAGLYPFVIAACESSTASLSVVYELVRAFPGLIISN